MDKLKLQWRVFAILLGFCALLLAILWLFQTVFLTNMYKWVRRGEMESAIQLVTQNIDNPNLPDLLADLQESKEILVMQTHSFSSPQRPAPDERGKRQPEALTETRSLKTADGTTLSLTFHAIITPVSATVSTLQVQLVCISGLLLVLSVLLAAFMAGRIAKPIVTINESAKDLASGHYDTHFEGHGFLEVRELSDTLNTAARELSKVEGLRRELMANVSHDLRTPLSLIYGYAEMMHDFPQEVSPDQSLVIMEEARRLSSLVDDILALSRLESDGLVLHTEAFSLSDHLQTQVQRMGELLRPEGYHIHFVAQESLWVQADRIKLDRAFYNLLVNAVNYCGEGKKISVLQEQRKGKVRITVIDDGAGIAPQELPHIWDRYYKLDKIHKRPITGTGLGLSIVRNILALHGGDYGVDSHLGQGSRFWFELKTMPTPPALDATFESNGRLGEKN